MIDIFDIMAFVVMAVLATAAVVVVVGAGMLPGWIAEKRGHPQAAAVAAAGWLGLATFGLLWPLALVWAFVVPRGAAGSSLQPALQWRELQRRIEALEAAAAREKGAQK